MKYQSHSRAAVCAVLTTLAVTPCHALDLRVFDPVKHLRMNDFPTSPTQNPFFLNATGAASTRLDLSGIGWNVQDPLKQLTLVSPRHFVGANHFRPQIGSSVRFLGTDNVAHTVTIASIQTIPNDDLSVSDVFLGEFTTDLPAMASVLAMPYLNLPMEGNYVGEALVISGQAARGGRGTVGSVSDFGGDPITGGVGIKTRAFTFSYGPVGTADDCKAGAGDSGAPSFAIRSGKAALVGTHTAILAALGTTTTYDTLVPHYVPRLNARMEEIGYHMRAITPAATRISATGAGTPPKIPAGRPFLYRVTLTNGAAAADNLVATLSPPPGLGLTSATADGWLDNGAGSLRRGGLVAGGATVLEFAFAGSLTPGGQTLALTVKSDGSGTQEFAFPVTILSNFSLFTAGLQDASATGDDDRDGISNLQEYACGGDPAAASLYFPGSDVPLQMAVTDTGSLRFIRRTDAQQRGLSYQIERSASLADDWRPVTDASITTSAGPAEGFEIVTAVLPASSATADFARLRIELAE